MAWNGNIVAPRPGLFGLGEATHDPVPSNLGKELECRACGDAPDDTLDIDAELDNESAVEPTAIRDVAGQSRPLMPKGYCGAGKPGSMREPTFPDFGRERGERLSLRATSFIPAMSPGTLSSFGLVLSFLQLFRRNSRNSSLHILPLPSKSIALKA
eukprot:CAMPEP_0178371586 /NCGR_PEP_ID=MMETSP0689_2-20121128/902_1 /TAXON_ID=160604 /ORGANISM="Amphidinium massartii, Strain CS-259" /LENGTH=155 /DNA_ID=CAMNT_0019991459 /DNA_START=397 /DNA_END=864 /DNA_ORIENTATION=-